MIDEPLADVDVVAGETRTSRPVARARPVSAAVFDMVRSLGVLVVVVALTLIFVPGLLHPSKSQRFAAVSYSDYTQGFKQVTGIAALVPAGLGSGWYANSAALTHRAGQAQLRIGWVTPSSDYLALQESNEPAGLFVATVLGAKGAKVVGRVGVDGATWVRRTSAQGEAAISRTIGRVTVVIVGSGTAAAQSELAAALHTA